MRAKNKWAVTSEDQNKCGNTVHLPENYHCHLENSFLGEDPHMAVVKLLAAQR